MTCGPCRVEMPRWGAFLATHKGADVVTIDTDVVPGVPGSAEAFLTDREMPTNDAWRFAVRLPKSSISRWTLGRERSR